MTNDGSLTARDIAVIPPVSGQDNVQDALSAGGGGGGGFPVGPLDDGTNTYAITADGSTLATSNTLDADSDANALLQLEVIDAATSSLKAHAQIPGSLTEMSLLGSGSFALSADDGTNTYAVSVDSGDTTLIKTTDDATSAYAQVALQVDGSDVLGQYSVDSAAGHSGAFTIEATDTFVFVTISLDGLAVVEVSPTSVVLASAAVPEGDPHIDRVLFTVGYVQGVTAGQLMISAG